MPRINPIDLEQPGPAEEIIKSVKLQLGAVPNIFATFAQSPAVLQGFLAFNGALSQGELSAAVREQIALAVAGSNECDYCASAHTALAKSAGVSDEEAARNLGGDASDPKVAAILKFVRLVVANRGFVQDNDVQDLRFAGVNEAELVEIIANIGANIFTNYFNHIAQTDIDFPRVDSVKAA